MNIYDKTAAGAEVITVEVLSADRIGLVSELCGVISSMGADIRGHRAKVYKDDKGRLVSRFEAEVRLGGGADALLHRISRVEGVKSVTAY